MTCLLIGKMKQPIIHIDWSDLDDRKQHFLIRASLEAQGRSLTLYEEIHPLNKKEKPKTHLLFLKKLNHILMPFIGFNVIPFIGFNALRPNFVVTAIYI